MQPLKCTDVAAALGALKARPGEPYELRDKNGKTVFSMFVISHFELKNAAGHVLNFDEDEALAMLSFLEGPLRLEPMDAARYFEENA